MSTHATPLTPLFPSRALTCEQLSITVHELPIRDEALYQRHAEVGRHKGSCCGRSVAGVNLQEATEKIAKMHVGVMRDRQTHCCIPPTIIIAPCSTSTPPSAASPVSDATWCGEAIEVHAKEHDAGTKHIARR